MINPSDITRAIETAFNTDPVFNTFTIERAELVNENAAICPWLGIYRGEIEYTPETLGQGSDYWTAIMTLILIVQSSNLGSGTQAEDDLEGLRIAREYGPQFFIRFAFPGTAGSIVSVVLPIGLDDAEIEFTSPDLTDIVVRAAGRWRRTPDAVFAAF